MPKDQSSWNFKIWATNLTAKVEDQLHFNLEHPSHLPVPLISDIHHSLPGPSLCTPLVCRENTLLGKKNSAFL